MSVVVAVEKLLDPRDQKLGSNTIRDGGMVSRLIAFLHGMPDAVTVTKFPAIGINPPLSTLSLHITPAFTFWAFHANKSFVERSLFKMISLTHG